MGGMACVSNSGVVEVLGTLDVFPGVPGGAEHFDVPDAFELVATSITGIVCVNFLPEHYFSANSWEILVSDLFFKSISNLLLHNNISTHLRHNLTILARPGIGKGRFGDKAILDARQLLDEPPWAAKDNHRTSS